MVAWQPQRQRRELTHPPQAQQGPETLGASSPTREARVALEAASRGESPGRPGSPTVPISVSVRLAWPARPARRSTQKRGSQDVRKHTRFLNLKIGNLTVQSQSEPHFQPKLL